MFYFLLIKLIIEHLFEKFNDLKININFKLKFLTVSEKSDYFFKAFYLRFICHLSLDYIHY
jgi:hypothetical protein